MKMSPYPAGKAKTAGRERWASSRRKMNPITLQDCADVRVCGFKDNAKRRKFCDAANQRENTTMGVPAANATARPMRLSLFWNRCRDEAVNASTNQAMTSPRVNLA